MNVRNVSVFSFHQIESKGVIIMDFKQYMGKTILAWLSYNENYEDSFGGVNRVCYVYPRVSIKDSCYDLIDPNDFPKYGRIEVRIQGGDSAEDVFLRFGSLVSIRINKDIYPNYDGNNMYSLKYNPQFGKVNSEIWVEAFSGKGFFQIIDLDSNIETLQRERSIPEPSYAIRTTLILLRCGNKLYGPFEYDTKEGTVFLRGIKDYQYTIGEYNAVRYNDELLVITDQNDDEAIIVIPKTSRVSPEDAEAKFDWINEETLVDNFIEILRIENRYTRDQARQLREMAYQLLENNAEIHFSEERIAKVRSLLTKIAQKEEFAQLMVQYALSDESSMELLLGELVSHHFDLIERNIVDFTAVRERLTELKSQETAMQQHIQELQAKTEDIKEIPSEDIQHEISVLQETIESLKGKNAELSTKIDVSADIDALKLERDEWKRKRDSAKSNYDQQLIDNRDLEKQFNSTLESFNDQAKQTARILDSKLLDKILRGVGEDSDIDSLPTFETSCLHSESMDHTAIIHRVTDFINDKAHRDVTVNDVANYLICITQGFITTFAGEPGTGKTSLCNILAKALGLSPETTQKRFVDVSVERGWSSHKDFIGYYNPLTKSMEKSNIEVFNAFSRLNNEYGCAISDIAPFIILLDEANLSPLEHYWAAFLRNCDFTSVSNRSIALGGNSSFKLPEHLRFLATVNFDHTTEELSPRFLDRSWVIMLEPSRIDDDADECINNFDDMVSFGDIKLAFSANETDSIDEAILTKWNAIQKIFRERSLQIMPRNLKMVKNYCAVGCRCMERDTPTTKLAPLDYAFSQKILPTINGSGDNYRILIEELLKECTMQNMPISARHLERMKRVAENNMGFYQFFSR